VDQVEDERKDDLIEKLRNDRDRYRYLLHEAHKQMQQMRSRFSEMSKESKALRDRLSEAERKLMALGWGRGPSRPPS
jgi:hypothetical protein